MIYSVWFVSILHWQPNQGSVVNSQVLNEISQCVESLNGVKEGRCKASLTFYRPNLRGYSSLCFRFLGFLVFSETLSFVLFFADQSVTIDFPCDFLGISMLEQPNKYYFIICGHKIVLEVDSSILLIMEKLQSYNSKVALHFKVHFVLRVPRFLFLCFCSLNLLWWFCREWCINRVTFKWESLKLFLVKHKVSKELWLSCLNSEL